MSKITPGQYLRDCRKRAGKSVQQVAQLVSGAPRHTLALGQAARLLERAEASVPGEYLTLAREISNSGALPAFHLGTFLDLCAASCATPGEAEDVAA